MALTDGLLAFWELEETSGTRVDAHSTHDLTDNNTVTSGTGVVGTAADFESSNSESLSVADHADLSGATDKDFTIAYWCKLETVPTTGGGALAPAVAKHEFGSEKEYATGYGNGTGRFTGMVRGADGSDYNVQVGNFEDVSAGTWYFVVLLIDCTNNRLRMYRNGSATVGSDTTFNTSVNNSARPLYLGYHEQTTAYLDGMLDQVGIWNRCLSTTEIDQLYNSGAGLSYAAMSGGASYSLTADSGTFTITGTAASLEYGRRLDAASGSFAITGTAASLEVGREVAAESGAFTITGTDATLIYDGVDPELSAESGTFAITGQDAGLMAARKLTAESGSFALAGQDASVRSTRKITAESGSFSFSGQTAALLVGREIAADAGSFALAGTAASLEVGRRLAADSGTYTLTGQDAVLSYSGFQPFRDDATIIPVYQRTTVVPIYERTITIPVHRR